jgi:hypothetical protein
LGRGLGGSTLGVKTNKDLGLNGSRRGEIASPTATRDKLAGWGIQGEGEGDPSTEIYAGPHQSPPKSVTVPLKIGEVNDC